MARNALQRSTLATACIIALMPGMAAAASFQILEQSPALQGTSFAGTASSAQDATTVFYNPAAMARLEGQHFTVGGSLIQPTADFNDSGSGPQTGPESTTDESALVPSVYYVMPLNEKWTFGFGVNAPFGLSSKYDKDWIGRYHATNSELQLLNINPTFAYQVDDRLSIGAGLNYQRIDATLENEVNPLGNTRSQDSSAKVEGDDDGLGLDLSLFYEVTDRTNVGVLWRQGVKFTLEGNVKFNKSAACIGVPQCNQGLANGDIEADVEIPDTLNFSVSHQLDNRWTLHGDVAWTQWSSIDKIEINRKSDGSNVSTLDLDYDDTMRYAFGATFHDGGPWTWRGGIALDQAPQTDPELQTPRVPDEDRTWLSAGFNYAFSPSASLDFGYTHIFVGDININNTVQQGATQKTLTGDFDATIDILAVQGNWTF